MIAAPWMLLFRHRSPRDFQHDVSQLFRCRSIPPQQQPLFWGSCGRFHQRQPLNWLICWRSVFYRAWLGHQVDRLPMERAGDQFEVLHSDVTLGFPRSAHGSVPHPCRRGDLFGRVQIRVRIYQGVQITGNYGGNAHCWIVVEKFVHVWLLQRAIYGRMMLRMDKDQTLYAFVMRHLRAKRLTQRQVAAGSGVPFSTIAKIAQGLITNPRINTLQALADFFERFDNSPPCSPACPLAAVRHHDQAA